MLSKVDNILRVINAIFLVLTMAFISALLNTQRNNSSRINFCMFAAAFGLLTDSFFGVAFNMFDALASWPILLFIFDFLNFVFTFTAGTVLAVAIRAHSCKNERYVNSNSITQGSENRCRMSQAAVAFFYFSCFIFLAKMIMSGINMASNGLFGSGTWAGSRSKRRTNRSGANEVGVPTISQV
ncbi:Nce102p NDAI_0B05880 [Naumovozyma dairenensis CBS 421]|uniref:MARVEL domain-containing protein n=1 Tax=Naumovozyma dairenensis (strain ATCC 10597 / BCRC 20456 / CBS 421 / NBRC 0211 / NRRL Y-12639) TaxID=1071378 RepID=G0W759_NAUDC|nr:hypothetical protein NDAI_0B05880 [Naumovozyma dairenensis CBS 421]CCD23620.1 hypothetical protein NDAI_0B05880 [Naumovozyma dairenensis CBS 421]